MTGIRMLVPSASRRHERLLTAAGLVVAAVWIAPVLAMLVTPSQRYPGALIGGFPTGAFAMAFVGLALFAAVALPRTDRAREVAARVEAGVPGAVLRLRARLLVTVALVLLCAFPALVVVGVAGSNGSDIPDPPVPAPWYDPVTLVIVLVVTCMTPLLLSLAVLLTATASVRLRVAAGSGAGARDLDALRDPYQESADELADLYRRLLPWPLLRGAVTLALTGAFIAAFLWGPEWSVGVVGLVAAIALLFVLAPVSLVAIGSLWALGPPLAPLLTELGGSSMPWSLLALVPLLLLIWGLNELWRWWANRRPARPRGAARASVSPS